MALNADVTKSVFVGRNASETTVKQMDLSGIKVQAFATPGSVPGDLNGLLQPALALSSPKVVGGKDDGLLTMGEILALKLDADWVVLSACNTGSGQGAGAGGEQRFGQRGPESRGSGQGGGDRQGFDGGFRGGPGEDSGGGGRRGGRGVGGAIESIEGNTLTVTTPRGPVTVTTGGDTTVRKIVDGSLEDLEQGAQIRVTGQRDEEGIVKATSITLIPEGAQEFIGRRGPRQER